MIKFNVEVITDDTDSDHESNSTGLVHLPEFKGLDGHEEIAKHKPASKYGEVTLHQLDDSGLFTWVKPVSGGTYESTSPLFKVEVVS